MAVINPDHLLEQAEQLIVPPLAGPPRQADLRRSISAAYYAVFHFTLTAAADQYVGKTKHKDIQYGLVYRSVDHKWLRELCENVQRQTLSPKYRPYAPANGFGPSMAAFAAAVLELQQRRHAAEYDPMIRVRTADSALAIRTARSALVRFGQASALSKKAFLSLLLFPPR